MQITRQAEYAIRIMLELSSLPKGEFTHSKLISEKRKVPDQFLQKTIQILVRSRMVESRRGVMGGVRLAVKPESVTIADIIKAVEGEFYISPCLHDSFYCGNKSKCQVTKILQRAQDALMDELKKESLLELSRQNVEREITCQEEDLSAV